MKDVKGVELKEGDEVVVATSDTFDGYPELEFGVIIKIWSDGVCDVDIHNKPYTNSSKSEGVMKI